jgi:Tfp pilus assembly protein PilF/CheY-like chemotaxis protein
VHSVLLIDDDPAFLETIRIVSERSHEMTVETAPSAQEGLKIIQGKSFDAIIAGYDMPGISGVEFVKIIRMKGNTTPVILFTAAGREHAATETLNECLIFCLIPGGGPRVQFRELVTMARRAIAQKSQGQSPGTTHRIISDMINFSSDPGFAIDRDGKVVAWNDAMEQFTDVPASAMMGMGDFAYAEPFFGARKKMLVDLVFSTDEEIRRSKYMLINRDTRGTIIAVTRGQKHDGSEWTLWAKAKPIYDGQENFIAVVSTLRDITATFGDVPLREDAGAEPQPSVPIEEATAVSEPEKGSSKKVLGRALIYYKEGVDLYVRKGDFTGAVAAFDKALAIDDRLSYAWNDRGTCYRELGDNTNALKSHLRAVELASENPEFLFNLGETLESIGVLNKSNKYLDSAIQTFKMVVDLLPNNAAAWDHLGTCHNEMGKREESAFYFDRARDIKHWKKDTPLILRRDEFL